jgi:hypothetical protein
MRRGASNLKDVKYEGRSGNVYENKGPYDNLPERKDDICAGSHAFLHKNAGILCGLAALLQLLGRWETNLLLPKIVSQRARACFEGPCYAVHQR